MEKITFKTLDGVKIVGNYFSPTTPSTSGVLCLHMMPETKESWGELALFLSNRGIHVLAIDERGHGESIWYDDEPLNYQQFSDVEQQAKRLDIDAALQWMQTKGMQLNQTAIIGASIGANLALDTLVRFPAVPAAALLSPGQDFRGIQTDSTITKLQPNQKILLVASADDKYSFETIERLDILTHNEHETWRLKRAGHGTHMFSAEPGLLEKVAEWLEKSIQKK